LEQNSWPADKVERWPIDRLVPYARNARTHSDEQVEQVAASIREWGWTNPVLVGEDGGIIAGHCRVLAGRQLGLVEVPVMLATGWSEAQKRAYVLADNQLALNAGWNPELLRLELGELQGLEFDLGLIGFDEAQLAALTANPGLTDPDEVPEAPAVPIAQRGEVWQLGRHRLMCGDATSAEDMRRLFDGSRADLIVTDPPYGVSMERGKFQGNNNAPKHAPMANDQLRGDDLTEFLTVALRVAFEVAKDCAAYVWAPSLAEGYHIMQAVTAAGFKVQSQLIWRKTPFVMGRADYHWQHEVCWYAFKPNGHSWYGGRDKSTVWDCPKPQQVDLHPTMKPVALYATAIENSSKGGDLVLDMFAGAGPLAIACEQAGRDARMLELDAHYCDVIIERWENFTGEKARRA
jgi:DNA modification methylase